MASKPHHMTARFGGLNGSFAAQLKGFADRAKNEITQVFREVVIQVGTRVVRLSPVDTGRFVANWQLTEGVPASFSVNDVDQDGAATIARLVAMANTLDAGQTAWLVNNLVYALPLEYGHSKQAPAGMVQITVAEFDQIVRAAASKVSGA